MRLPPVQHRRKYFQAVRFLLRRNGIGKILLKAQQEGQMEKTGATRRELLTAIGMAGGTAALYQAMTTMGHAAETQYAGPPDLSGARAGASVLVLGAGLAGMLAAYELNKAGYKVRILEYQNRAGGRNWSLQGGDSYTELGGATQNIAFAQGQYFNPGPWRIPYAADHGLRNAGLQQQHGTAIGAGRVIGSSLTLIGTGLHRSCGSRA